MTRSKTTSSMPAPVPTPTTPDFSASAIAELGAGLTRLAVALVPLSLRAVDALSTNLPHLVSEMTAAADATGTPQGSTDFGRAAGDLASATARLLKATVQELNTAASTTEANQSQRR